MKISLTQKEIDLVNKLLDVKEKNISSVEYYIDYLINHCRDINFAKDEMDFFFQFNKIENADEDVIENSNMSKITKLNKSEFLQNDYLKTIGEISAKEDDWQFMSLEYAPYEGFVSDEISISSDFFNEFTPLSYFDEEFKYLAVLQNDEVWMSVIPHEINTMKEPIKNATGNVLVLGLGLGYYLFNVVKKEDVKKVTVIENDKKIINLFNKYLISKFPHQEKINIVLGDAIEFMKNPLEQYDYVFSDIWHNVGDGEMLYLNLKNKEKNFTHAKFDYWIEKSILAMLRRQVLTVIKEQLDGADESLYLNAENDNDAIINSIYFYLKDKEIKTFNDLHEMLSEESLKVMATKLF